MAADTAETALAGGDGDDSRYVWRGVLDLERHANSEVVIPDEPGVIVLERQPTVTQVGRIPSLGAFERVLRERLGLWDRQYADSIPLGFVAVRSERYRPATQLENER